MAKCLAIIKELLDPKCFNFLSYIVIVIWLLIDGSGSGIIAFMDIAKYADERKIFDCDLKSERKDYIQGLCYDRYQNEHTRSIPLYGFWLLNWVCISIVCVVYCQCVKSKVCELDTEDIERQRNQRLAPSRWLYRAYCCQLTVRLVVECLFLILQTQVLYPSNFPTVHYDCTLSGSHYARQNVNITSSVAQNVSYQCRNPIAMADVTVCVVNGLLVLCILIEMIYVLYRVKVTNSFKLNFNFFQTYILGKCSEPQAVQGYRVEMENSILDNTGLLDPLMSFIPGEAENNRVDDSIELDFEKVYTNLVICPGRVQYDFSKDRHEVLEGYVKSKQNQRPIDKLEDIFAPGDDSRKIHKILIVGRPGIGKTTLCDKLIRDIAGRKWFVFLFKFRNYNTDENLNFQQWLSSSEYSATLSDDVLTYIRTHPDKVFCIFDGLDEFLYSSNIIDENQIHTDTSMPFSAFYGKLVSGKFLTGATVVTTSRPTGLSASVGHIAFDRTLEILGFSPEQVKEYVNKVVPTSDDAEQIWTHIKDNANLLSLCYIPVNCCIVCTSLLYRLHTTTVTLPTTLTKIYEDALKVFICKHNPEYRANTSEQEKLLQGPCIFMETVNDSLLKLGEKALNGTSEQRLIFEEKRGGRTGTMRSSTSVARTSN